MHWANKNIGDLNIREELCGSAADVGEFSGLSLSSGDHKALPLWDGLQNKHFVIASLWKKMLQQQQNTGNKGGENR